MASLMENLIDVLGKLCDEYENLLGLSTQKTPVIIAGDLKELSKITDEEQIVVSIINHLDRSRQEAVRDIANVVNRDVEDLKLANIIQMLEPRPVEQQKLAVVYDRLTEVVGQVRRVNSQNRELLSSALEMVEFEINMLQAVKAAPATANYNKGAYSSGSVIGVDRSDFDAKQ
ncbi:flagellar protein FlgN [Kineothrix sp. MB12-C1]|uniref:flagellar protein FlgN n=1 Tax=Kineothrix sp. MB12-C1 TaxID=3070215 RepID=UPI0027D2289C|nr:flagellar protein FlgN [Kineothrix sp. MB12-C1]WMC93895.1 flagellar protein FlgN [Kineothrix sp. MB12-C1]